MQRRLLSLVTLSTLLCAFALGLLGEAHAVDTDRFLLDDATSLRGEDLEGTAVLSSGRVVVGAQTTRVALEDDASAALVYALALDGEAAYLGTGDEGRVLRARGERVDVLAETGQLLVTSLARAGRTLYAGTIGEGKLFAIPLGGGEPQEIALPEGVEHVWALAWMERTRRLVVGTGPEGLLLEVDPTKQGEDAFRTLLDTDAAHVLSVALDEGNALYAGTSEDALVYRVETDREPSVAVVHDFPGNEITALAARNGVLAVAANDLPAPRPTPAKTKGRNAASPRPRPGKGRLYRVDGDGRVERVFANDEGHFAALAIDAEGAIYVGEAKEGRVFRVNPDRTHATWLDLDERQVLALAMDGRELVLATGDAGALYRVAQGRGDAGRWTSKALDARFRSRWGRLAWRSEGRLELRTRSGNREEPDESWSAWSAPLREPGPIRSPAARYLQVEARLLAPDAELRALEAYYLPRNQRPTVRSVGLKAPAKKAGRGLPAPSRNYPLSWSVANADGDTVRYRLRFRSEGQATWRDMLPEERELTETSFTWDTRGVPDGWYVVEVEASDELANPASLALRSTRESEPILVDNHAPAVEGLALRGREVRGRAVDSLGPIRRLEQAIDGGPFRPLQPDDGLLDEAREELKVDLSGLSAGPHLVAVRATDAGGNAATAELEVVLR